MPPRAYRWEVGRGQVLGRLSYSEHRSAALSTFAASGRVAVFHGRFLRILHLAGLPALQALSGHYNLFIHERKPSSLVVPAHPIQEAGLDSRIASGCRVPRILSGRHRLSIVLAVNPQPLNNLQGVLLMLIRVGLRGFEERVRHMVRSVHRLYRLLALEIRDSQLGFNRLRHCASSRELS